MKSICFLLFCLFVSVALGAEPIRLHPENPHYFLFRGKPAVLVTSTEHYGAVLNLDFDFLRYLDELQSHGLNLCRVFSGVYCEAPGNFNIRGNTLAPAEGRLICPWARSDQPGYANGGNKFDLKRWDARYFERLKQFVGEAGNRGIVVELVLFCPFYEDSMWKLSPLNAANNINGIGKTPRTDAYALKDDALSAVQTALARKLAEELKDFDNLYYEICNEPYFGGVTLDWQSHLAATLAETEKDFAARHLIAQNVANGSQKIVNPDRNVSLFNFHYATPPDAVGVNYALDKPIGDDETGFRGREDAVYRGEGWEFLLAGGAVYNNLDFSFSIGHEDGSAKVDAPGGGGRMLREQLGALKRFVESFDFVAMRPDKSVIAGGIPEKASVQALVNPGREYAIYVRGGDSAELTLKLSPGEYRAEWFRPRTGKPDGDIEVKVVDETVRLKSPPYADDIALAIRRLDGKKRD